MSRPARGNRAASAHFGAFFCAAVGERTYLRFVPADDDWRVADEPVVREDGTCLRIIECEQDTPRWFPDWLEDRVYDFWDVAREDILDDWMVETDSANLQPKVRPLNLRVAEFIRGNPPPGMEQAQIERALDILESPWPRREEIMLRSDERTGTDAARFLVEQVLETGLEPAAPPEPLPPITADDIELVCWMGGRHCLTAADLARGPPLPSFDLAKGTRLTYGKPRRRFLSVYHAINSSLIRAASSAPIMPPCHCFQMSSTA